MTTPAKLDHTVVNCRYQMDQAEAAFRDLGFHLTDRGYHTLGSINHLMMFGTDYLELIGLPEGAEGKKSGRPDIENAPFGINGLVFKTDDADETFAHLEAIGMSGDPVKAFSRPVELADGSKSDARFRTAHVRSDVFPGGRVYFCEHGTPELVWRPEWQSHDNGVQAMPEFVIASQNHVKEAGDFARLLRADVEGAGDCLSVAIDGCRITVLTPAAYKERYGALATPLDGRQSIFGAMVMRTGDLDAVRKIAANVGVPVIDETGRLVLKQPDFSTVLEFIH